MILHKPVHTDWLEDTRCRAYERNSKCRLDACNQPLKGSSNCQLDPGHRGRHSSIVFQCDGCNKYRRSYPSASHSEAGQFCFMCVKVWREP